LYQQLREKYGEPSGQWRLWCKRPKTEKEKQEVAMGAILTQRTNWKNVELAFSHLKKAGISSLKDIYKRGPRKISFLIKPSGFYEAKAQYLFNLAEFILLNYGTMGLLGKQDLKKIRRELLDLKGIGPETADSILLYALDRPVFVIDEYTRRLVKQYKLSSVLSYNFLQELFEKNLEKDFRLFQDFHGLIVIDGKNRKDK